MNQLESIQSSIKDELGEFEKIFSSSMKSNVPLLGLITNHLLRKKGKQMRPMFVFFSAQMHGGIVRATYTAATMIELLHAASLVHDDVVDESYERRGYFSINAIWKSKISVLLGDFLLARGLLVAVENEAFDLLRIVSQAVQEMSEGELQQIQQFRKKFLKSDEYFEIIQKKTATLIAACTAAGAKSAGADKEGVQKMKDIGVYVGIAFQIKDDLFDYERKSLTGKPNANDIKEKKITLPLICALEQASAKERNSILKLLHSKDFTNKKVDAIIQFVEKYDGLEYSRTKMNEYKSKALNLLAEYPASPAKESFIQLINYTTDRTH
jgi:octaprenyl-diphosphate synthase